VIIAGPFFSRKLTLGMGIEIGPVAAKGEHEQQLGVQARRGDAGGGEAGDGGGEGVAEAHVAISPQTDPRDQIVLITKKPV
jgi:hypothetical protein